MVQIIVDKRDSMMSSKNRLHNAFSFFGLGGLVLTVWTFSASAAEFVQPARFAIRNASGRLVKRVDPAVVAASGAEATFSEVNDEVKQLNRSVELEKAEMLEDSRALLGKQKGEGFDGARTQVKRLESEYFRAYLNASERSACQVGYELSVVFLERTQECVVEVRCPSVSGIKRESTVKCSQIEGTFLRDLISDAVEEKRAADSDVEKKLRSVVNGNDVENKNRIPSNIPK